MALTQKTGSKFIRDSIEKLIFSAKWLLIPFYLKLFYTLLVLLWYFILYNELPNEILMHTLHAVDIVMIANLVKMIITGSYHSFIDKTHNEEIEKVSSGMLKVKMSTSILGVTSIHLLQTFVNSQDVSWDLIYKQVFIHLIVIVGSVSLALIDYWHCKSDKH